MMKKIMTRVEVELTVEEIVEINKMIDRETPMDGLMDDKSTDYRWNRCPKCDRAFLNDGIYCKDCGQKLRFIDYSTMDVLPL
jgi:hypothetical protein